MKKENSIGFWFCSALIIGNMVGSGIFLLPSNLAQYGAISIGGWIISFIGAICLASVFADLSKKIPRGGGPYAYTFEGFGEFAAFWVAWGYWISIWSAVAAIAIAFTGALSVFFPILNTNPLLASLTASAAIVLLSLVNLLDLRRIGQMQMTTTILKLTPLLAIGLFAFSDWQFAHFTPVNLSGESHFSALIATAALTMWAFLGFESSSIISHKVKNAALTVPRATLLSTLFVALVYILSSTAVMAIVEPHALSVSAAPYAEAATQIWGTWAGYAVAAGTAISCFGAMNGWILLQGQIPHAAATDRLFPQTFAKLSGNGTPVFGVIFSSAMAIALIVLNNHISIVAQFGVLILLSTLTALVPYCFSAMTHLLLLFRSKNDLTFLTYARKLVITSVAFLFALFAIIGSGESTVYYGFLLLLAGLPVYIWMKAGSK
ncbi:MAG: amino acid permease [Deferribacteres bacterium]|nr:amino acid permease [candidate division KSB1 bacterium]MCB9501600.1 amino acid permease [Deferribacteres bacterium]